MASFFVSLLNELKSLLGKLGGWLTKLGVLLIVTCWFWMNCYFNYSPGMENFRRTMHLQLRPIVPEILICLFSRQIRLEGKAG